MAVHTKIYRLFIFLLLASAPVLANAQVAVIVNAANTQSLSIEDIREIYAGTLTHWTTGNKIIAYNLPTASAARKIFYRKIRNLSRRPDYKGNKHNSNQHQIKRERLLISSIAYNENAIGYTRAESVKHNSKIKILYLFN